VDGHGPELRVVDAEVGAEVARRHGAPALAVAAEGLVAGDGVEPRPQAGGVAQLGEGAGGVDERVVQRVGRLVLVAEDRPAVVVQAVGVAVVDGAPRLLVASAGGSDERGVIHGAVTVDGARTPPWSTWPAGPCRFSATGPGPAPSTSGPRASAMLGGPWHPSGDPTPTAR